MRAVFEMERGKMSMLQKSAADKAAQHPAQGKAAKFIKRTLGSWTPSASNQPKRT
jgi:hypothetical protein